DPSNNSVTRTTTVLPGADLSLSMTGSPHAVAAGQPLTYTLVVANHGPFTATDVILTDTLPVGVSFGSASPAQGTCSQSGSPITCPLGTLLTGQQTTATIRVTALATATGSLVNRATVTSDLADPNPADNTPPQLGTVIRAPGVDLEIGNGAT